MSAKPTVKKAAVRFLQRHLKQTEKGTNLFRASSESLNQALANGVPLNTPITLRDGRIVYVRDLFDGRNEAFAAKVFHRYKVEPYKEPKPVRPPKAAATETPAAESEVAR